VPAPPTPGRRSEGIAAAGSRGPESRKRGSTSGKRRSHAVAWTQLRRQQPMRISCASCSQTSRRRAPTSRPSA